MFPASDNIAKKITDSIFFWFLSKFGQLCGIFLVSQMIIRGGENDIIENGKLAGYESQHYKCKFILRLKVRYGRPTVDATFHNDWQWHAECIQDTVYVGMV